MSSHKLSHYKLKIMILLVDQRMKSKILLICHKEKIVVQNNLIFQQNNNKHSQEISTFKYKNRKIDRTKKH